MNAKFVLFSGLFLALSGCAGVGSESALKYDGTENGSHSETSGCDDEGKLKGSGHVPDGQVVITLEDSDSRQLMQQTFKGDFTLPEQTVTGASGTWSLEAQRSGDDLAGDAFAGDYAFYLNC